MRLFPVLFASSLLALASCGGGGSTSQPSTPPPVTAACVKANYTGAPDLTLLAGNMGAGHQTGDGPAAYALFTSPIALDFDAKNRLYILDEDSLWERAFVRRLQDGMVVTVAGSAQFGGSQDGTGSAASLNGARAAVMGPDGNLYLTFPYPGTIRRVTAAGVVTTIAGQAGENSQVDGPLAAARFEAPFAIGADRSGNLYVSDTGTLRKISADGQVTTVAGSREERVVRDGPLATARFAGISALEVDASGAVYISDNGTIRRLANGVVTTLAGQAGSNSGSVDGPGPAARFASVGDLAVDTDGTVYAAESHAIRRISPEGVVTTLAGSGAAGDQDGTGTSASFGGARGIALDSQGGLWVADSLSHLVRRVTKTGEVATASGVRVVQGSADGTAAAATFQSPQWATAECSGQFVVADGNVRRVSPNGAVATVPGTTGLGGPLIADTNGDLLLNGTINGLDGLFKYTSSGLTRVGDPTRAMAYDRQGVLYFISGQQVKKRAKDGTITVLAGNEQRGAMFPREADGTGEAAYFVELNGIAVDKDGNVFVSEGEYFSKPNRFTNGVIRKITPAGVVTTVAGKLNDYGFIDGPGASARLQDPHGLAFDDAGNLYIADTGNNAIRKMTPDGVVSTVLGHADTASPERQSLYQTVRQGAFVPGPLGQASVLAPRWIAINGNTMAITAQQGVLLLRGLP